jgi:hypothetical protein
VTIVETVRPRWVMRIYVRGPRWLLCLVAVLTCACDRWGSQAREPDAIWTVALRSVVIDVDPTTNDVFAVVWEPGPALTRIAAADGSRVWSAPLPEQAVEYGVEATLAGTDVVLVAKSEAPFAIGSVLIPAGSSILRWSQADGSWVSRTAAPEGWPLHTNGGPAGNRRLAGATDGSIAAAYCEPIDCMVPVTVLEADGSVAWTVIPDGVTRITTLARSADGDVLVGANGGGAGVIRLRRVDGSVEWTVPLGWSRVDSIGASADGTTYAIGIAYSDDVAVAAITDGGERGWQTAWVPHGETYPIGQLDIGDDGPLHVAVRYVRSVTYQDHVFEGVGNDTVVAALNTADGTLTDYAEFGGHDQVSVGRVHSGTGGRVYVSASGLIAFELP